MIRYTRSKYGSRKTTVDGITFDSKREAKRWRDLQTLERGGVISELQRQVRFPLHAVNGIKICTYICDFTYCEDGKKIAEDAKGYRTQEYKTKRKWFIAEYGNIWEHRES